MGRKRSKRRNREPTRSLSTALLGRSFVHPAFDYLLIGGVLSLAFVAYFEWKGSAISLNNPDVLPVVILLATSAHFAASTVRLYTKPGVYQDLPFLTLAFPAVAALIVTLCMFFPKGLGAHLTSLYLTWSPYHYAAQAYGLAVMYCYRSGCSLGQTHKRLLWWVCMSAFFYNFLRGNETGLQWLVPASILETEGVSSAVAALAEIVYHLTYIAPSLLFCFVFYSKSGTMPLISLCVIIANSLWWIRLPVIDAFVWATIFHGIQYMAIVAIFHVKDQVARPENRHGSLYHLSWFYVACVLLGYGLFSCLPLAYEFVGFGAVESVLIVIAAINIHHFIVDAYIWRLKRTDGNRKIVESGQRQAFA